MHLPIVKVAIWGATATTAALGAGVASQTGLDSNAEHYRLMQWLVAGLIGVVGGLGALIWRDLRAMLDRIGTRLDAFMEESRSDRATLHQQIHDQETVCRFRHPEEPR